MSTSLGVDILVSLANKLTAPLKDAENTVAKASERMNKRLNLSLKLAGAGAAATGVAWGAQRLVTGFTDSIREVERAKGELATLGVKDLDAVVRKGRQMQYELAGVTADAFVRASYDIKSGTSSLTDQGVADMTTAAMVAAKATKGVPEQMTSLFATSYGIFKKQYAITSDADFGNMFGAALSASVQQFKTDGAAMQQAIETAGAGAVNLGMKMTEQLTLLGMMQQQMQAGEAGTALRAFATNAAKAHEAFQDMKISAKTPVRVRVLDENGQLRAMPDILADLKVRYGETLDAFEAAEIKKAFGTDEAMKLINALYGQEEAIRANADALNDAAEKGDEFTRQMARAADNNWDATMILMGQRIDVLKQKIGERLLPVVERIMPTIDKVLAKSFEWIDANPHLISTIGGVVAAIGGFMAIAGPLLITSATLVSTWALMSFATTKLAVGLFGLLNPLKLVRGALFLLRGAVIATGIGAIAVGLAMAGQYIVRNWEGVKETFSGLTPIFGDLGRIAKFAFEGDWATAWEGAQAVVQRFKRWWYLLDFAGKARIDAGIATIKAVFEGDWRAAWSSAQDVVSGFQGWWDGLDFKGKGTIEGVASTLASFGASLSQSFAPALQSLSDAWAQVQPVFANLGEAWTTLATALGLGGDDANATLSGLGASLGTLAGLGLQAVAGGIELIARGLETFTGVLAGALSGDSERVMTELREFFDWLTSGITLPDWMQNFSFSSIFAGTEAGSAREAIQSWFDFAWGDLLPSWAWDFIPAINMREWFNFSWGDILPDWDWGFIPEINLSNWIKWPSPPKWFSKLTGVGAAEPVQERASGGRYSPGWLLTGERGPELRYATEGGYIAHNRALQNMVGLASKAHRLVSDIPFGDMAGTMTPAPAMATVAASGGAAMRSNQISYAPQISMPMNFAPGADIEANRAMVREEIERFREQAQVDMRRMLHDG